ncbi:hypothetical protein DL95DRAFT_415067 [Leptodontidium sp. 2 PMI_412]|nr:hypothetical protein DL95DRAFT_415067 [Leptodontidium sp. 2 PMI_412]
MAFLIDNMISKSSRDRKLEVQRMLQGLTPTQFVDMPWEEREAVYMQYLVSPKILDFEGDDVPHHEMIESLLFPGVLLRREENVGADSEGRQIVREARQVYYMHNTFAVLSHNLRDFFLDKIELPVSVEGLVRKILVKVELQHIYDTGTVAAPSKSLDEEEEPWAALDLKQLLACKKAEWIRVQIQGGGPLDCSDLRSQIKVKEIAKVVQELIVQFPGERFSILKSWKDGSSYDLKPYWDGYPRARTPDLEHCREHLSFRQIMQMQVRGWTAASQWTRKFWEVEP